MLTRAECDEAVKVPGKFEGQPAYVPYFWDISLEGFCDYVGSSNTVRVHIDSADRAMFPELGRRRRVIYLHEDDQGFVTEA